MTASPKRLCSLLLGGKEEGRPDLLFSIFKQKAAIEGLISSPNFTDVWTNQQQAERGKTLNSLG